VKKDTVTPEPLVLQGDQGIQVKPGAGKKKKEKKQYNGIDGHDGVYRAYWATETKAIKVI